MKIRPVGAERLHADGRKDMPKLKGTFAILENAPDKGKFSPAPVMKSHWGSRTIVPLILNLITR